MKFNPEELFQIAATIWNNAIGLSIEPDASDSAANRPRSMAACIQIIGAWNGAILFDCPVEVAKLAASRMFNCDVAFVSVADLQDAIAELVNMIGGNFKALLPETCYLSLPAVVEGGDYSTRVPGSTLLGRLPLCCEGYSMSIAVLEKAKAHSAAA
jgi:chemotaxis protein CheX